MMRIIDLERHTGLDRATIRYYEKEGFILPTRLENGYREYAPEDEAHLLKIKLLRQLGMPLERIKKLQQGSEDFSAALMDQIQILEQKMQSTERARAVCQELHSSGVSYASLDAACYLEKLSGPAQSSAVQISREFKEPAVKREYHPIRRYVARILDYTLIDCLLRFVLIVLLRIRPFSDFLTNLIGYGIPFLAVPLFALLLHRFGTTPGKWVMGIRVDYCNGGLLPYSCALEREWGVLRHGMGFGIPIWEIWKIYKSYKYYGDHLSLDWDYEAEYVYLDWNVRKKAVFTGILAIIIALTSVSAIDIVKPKHRGCDLTISQFADNYNFYYTLTQSENQTAKLQSDGTWYPSDSGSVVIYIGGTPEIENAPFEYETEGEYIRRITYQNSWTDVFMLQPISGNLQLAAISVLMAQHKTSYSDLTEFEKIWKQELGESNGSIQYSNIEINWVIAADGCRQSGDYYICENEDQNATLSLKFEITIHNN